MSTASSAQCTGIMESECLCFFIHNLTYKLHNIIESVDSICRDGADTPIKP